MSKGKYSPTLTRAMIANEVYDRNAKGEYPAPYSKENYDEETMYDAYDAEGYDRYGYSAYENGKYVGVGSGVDRAGYTEYDYLVMTDEEFDNR